MLDLTVQGEGGRPLRAMVRWGQGSSVVHLVVHLREVPEPLTARIALAIARLNADFRVQGLTLDRRNQLVVRISHVVDDVDGLSQRTWTHLLATAVDTAVRAEHDLAYIFHPESSLLAAWEHPTATADMSP